MKLIPPTFIVGNIRSGTTLFHKTLQNCLPKAVDIDDFDPFEGRLIWQKFGCQMGSPLTGTFCVHPEKKSATKEVRRKMQEYCQKCAVGGKHIVNKNPHLANKIEFVHSVLPDAKFIHIIREPYATVASVKLLFQASMNGHNYWNIPFRQYWPEASLPCWSSIPAFPAKTPQNLQGFSSRLLCLPTGKQGRIREYLRRLLRPPALLPDAQWPSDPDDFYQKFPDKTRYYPGEGFSRIPESWVTINANIQRQLQEISSAQWITVSYDDLCSHAYETILRVGFIGANEENLDNVPKKLDVSRRNKWKKNLNESEQNEVKRVINDMGREMEVLRPLWRF